MVRETAYDEVFDSQRHFRIIMDSMARPGKLNRLHDVVIHPPPEINPASALVGLALLNADVSCFSPADAEAVAAYFVANTASRLQPAAEADFLFLRGDAASGALAQAKTGTLAYPDTGAFVVIDVVQLSKQPVADALVLRLAGPGVPGEETVFVRGLNADLLAAIRDKNAEYPLGVDAILTDQEDRILCLPRSNRFSFG
ncbi:MAG: phosphonate C-P lyase system protein PhnH [Ferruginibacter sp.]|nr:phosphonate C-P lyase system protein PhnH [Cytophagales bacterium]